MTVQPLTADEATLAGSAAAAVAAVLPTPVPLAPGAAQPVAEELLAGHAGAVVADLDGPVAGRVAVLVGPGLVQALSQSPLGSLDLAAALQPALDAAAAALRVRSGVGRLVEPGAVTAEVGASTAVRLEGAGESALLVLPETALRAAADPTPAAPAAPVAGAGTGVPLGVAAARRGIELLHGVDMEVTVEIGRTRMTVRELLDLAPGAVLELDRAAGSPADLLVNGRLIARGEVVVIDEDFGLRVTEIVTDTPVG